MNDTTIIKLAKITVPAVLLIVAGLIGSSMYRARLAAEYNVQRENIVQKANVERTEERSQFWQKLVPWGRDEVETGE